MIKYHYFLLNIIIIYFGLLIHPLIKMKRKYFQNNNKSSFYFLGGLIPYLGKIGSYWKFRIEEEWAITNMVSESIFMVLASTGKWYFTSINVDEGGEAWLENTYDLTNRVVVHDEDKIFR